MSGTDFHQHVWPDAVRRQLELRRQPPYLRGRELVLPAGGVFEVDPDAYAPEARLAELDRAGLERAVVSLPPTTEPTQDVIDAWHAGARELERESGGRLVPLAYEAALLGFAGTVIAAPRLAASAGPDSVLGDIECLDQFVFVHPAPAAPNGAPEWFTSGVAYAQQMLAAYAQWLDGPARLHPHLKVVFALLGGGAPFQIERLIRRGLDPQAPFAANVWFDTSSYGERALELTLQTFGAARLVFGSDAPVDAIVDARQATERFGAALAFELTVTNPHAVLTSGRQQWAA